MTATNPQVWLITGCSSGIGLEIAEVVLEAGHKAVVTARDASRVADLAARYGDRALPLALDVTVPEQVTRAVAEAERVFGRLDVLVNNAGYGYLAAIEEGEDAEVRTMFETNFFGTVAMVKAALPGMRARRSGHIINISSMTGLFAKPGTVYYSCSKWAMEALTEGLAEEVAPLGIKVCGVQPGAFRTDWSGRSMKRSGIVIDDYTGVHTRIGFIKDFDGKQPGDPRRIADAVLRLAGMENPPLRLLMGHDVYNAFTAKLAQQAASTEEWKEVTLDVNFPE